MYRILYKTEEMKYDNHCCKLAEKGPKTVIKKKIFLMQNNMEWVFHMFKGLWDIDFQTYDFNLIAGCIFFIVLCYESFIFHQYFRPLFSHFAAMKFFVKLHLPILPMLARQREKSQNYLSLQAFKQNLKYSRLWCTFGDMNFKNRNIHLAHPVVQKSTEEAWNSCRERCNK